MPVERLTPARLSNLKLPPAGVVDELLDTLARGLSLRVFGSGRASWTFRYRPKDGGARRRVTLGEYPTIGLAEARRRADRLRGEVSGGGDPQGAMRGRREAPTLSDLIDRYLAEEVRPKKKPRTIELYTYYLRKLVAPRLGSRKAHEVTPGAVDNLHRKLGAGTPVTANRAIVALSGVYTFAARRRLIADGLNPTRGLEKFREQSRERYLSTEEIGRLGEMLRLGESEGLAWPREPGGAASKHDRKPDDRKSVLSPHVAAALRLLLFTGCRLREILHLRWSEVDLQRQLLLLPDSKTGRKTVVLNAPALQVLAGIPRFNNGEFVILGDDRPSVCQICPFTSSVGLRALRPSRELSIMPIPINLLKFPYADASDVHDADDKRLFANGAIRWIALFFCVFARLLRLPATTIMSQSVNRTRTRSRFPLKLKRIARHERRLIREQKHVRSAPFRNRIERREHPFNTPKQLQLPPPARS